MSAQATLIAVPPSAARLTTSLRDIGYDLQSAVADLIDNSIAADARRILIRFEGDGDPRVLIADDGEGMTEQRVREALRFGSRRHYGRGELGRYGLGLKTASLSQARRITVVSRTADSAITMKQLSLDVVEQYDNWVIMEPEETDAIGEARDLVARGYRTVVVWEDLDRVIPDGMADGWARRRMASASLKTLQHVAMVFHRYLDGTRGTPVEIEVDGTAVQPWDPFARKEKETHTLPSQTFEVAWGGTTGSVTLDRWVLPPRQLFSSPSAFDSAAGPTKWNRSQGIYIYRADRLVQSGGWAGLRAIDEHTKIARCALSFDTDLDAAFNINVAKMRVSLPGELKPMLQRPVQEMCNRAEAVYRAANLHSDSVTVTKRTAGGMVNAQAGLAILAAASSTGNLDALRSIAGALKQTSPEIAQAFGLSSL